MTNANLEQIDVVSDGRIKASFSDDSLLLLNSDALSYTHITPNTAPEQHRTDCALRCHATKLTEVLRFRNLYFHDSFYSTWVLDEIKAVRKVQLSQEWSAQWPMTTREGLENGLIQFNGDLVCVLSQDGLARLVYDAVGERVSLRTPLELSYEETEWILEDKVCAIANCPAFWRQPLELAIASKTEHFSTRVPPSVPLLTQATKRKPLRESFPTKESWWHRRTTVFPNNELVVMVWTPEVLFQRSPTGSVHVWIAADESYLEIQPNGKYAKHRRRNPSVETLYSTSGIPDSIFNPNGQRVQYSRSKIVEKCLALRNQSSSTRDVFCDSQRTPLLSVEIQEEHRDSYGVFTAYIDGRVRVRFTDRTILNMDAKREKCELVLSSGKTVHVRCDCPCGVEEYVKLSLEFASWATTSPMERLKKQQILEATEEAAFRSRINAELYAWIASRDSDASFLRYSD